jgi:prepilin-type N-terminal cleavage/methylation domain-containing protein
MKITPVSRHSGFTLVELMVAAAASLIVIGVTISSLVTLQQMNQRLEDRLTQEAEIQRSLNFIAADIQEGKSIQKGAPTVSGYSALFHVVRPDGTTIGYYITARGKRPWSGPKIIYRRDSQGRREESSDLGEDPSSSGKERSYALIDQIADQSPQHCTGKSTDVQVNSSSGFSMRIDNQTKATVCLRGHLLDSPDGIEASIQAVTRTGP